MQKGRAPDRSRLVITVQSARKARPSAVTSEWPAKFSERRLVSPASAITPALVMFSSRR